MKSFFTIISILLFIPLFSSSQDFEKDMKALWANYSGSASYEMQVDYRLYKDHLSTKIIEHNTVTLKKEGNNYYSNLFGIITVVNAKYLLIVDNKNQTIMIDKRPPEKDPSEEPVIRSDTLMEQLLKLAGEKTGKWIKTVRFEKNGKNSGLYTITFNYGDYLMQKIWFNTTAFTINKMDFFYDTAYPVENDKPSKPRLEVIYTKFTKGVSQNNRLFSEEQYLTVNKKGGVMLNDNYSGYTVINHLLSKGDYERLYKPQNFVTHE
ncbi:MAG: hypothetical protein HYY40_11790 [Bacteroidetes bacterium]|nr:hypothetical protein [Bacteroidota bacterium]